MAIHIDTTNTTLTIIMLQPQSKHSTGQHY